MGKIILVRCEWYNEVLEAAATDRQSWLSEYIPMSDNRQQKTGRHYNDMTAIHG